MTFQDFFVDASGWQILAIIFVLLLLSVALIALAYAIVRAAAYAYYRTRLEYVKRIERLFSKEG